jgi:hypothetical protein
VAFGMVMNDSFASVGGPDGPGGDNVDEMSES